MLTNRTFTAIAAMLIAAGTAEAAGQQSDVLQNFDANMASVQQEQTGYVSGKPQIAEGVRDVAYLAGRARMARVLGVMQPSSQDARRNSFLWAGSADESVGFRAFKQEASPENLARSYLYERVPLLNVESGAISQAALESVSRLPSGASIVQFRQQVNGFPVFGRRLNVMLDAQKNLIATSGYFAAGSKRIEPGSEIPFALSPAGAAARALTDMGGKLPAGVFQQFSRKGDFLEFRPVGVTAEYLPTRPTRIRKVLFPLHGELVPAYYVETFAGFRGSNYSDAFAHVISARDGSLLYRKNLQAHANFTYKVYADPKNEGGTPWDSPLGKDFSSPYQMSQSRSYASANSITVEDYLTGLSAPWLPAGSATLDGNNAYAYIDNGNDGFNATDDDYLTSPTANATFSYTLNPNRVPTEANNRDVALVNAFYVVNWLHDRLYELGFDEAAGNAQKTNYTSAGKDGDPILVEVQDSSGRNNANMSTPADGGSPRMQMYLFDLAGESFVDVTTPAIGKLEVGTAEFGPQSFNQTASVVRFEDGNSATDACVAADNPGELNGNIAIMLRGECNFTVKVKNAQDAGAVAAIIVNNVTDDAEGGGVVLMGGTDASITIGALSLKQSDGQPLLDELASGGSVVAQVKREEDQVLDGGLDSGIVAHEVFHYVSNRLVNDGSGLVNNQGGSMGEGWSDFMSLWMFARASDAAISGNDQWQGAYSVGTYVDSAPYFGIRRYPYSTQESINPLMFKHIEYGTALPDPETGGPPIRNTGYLDGTFNTEVHAAGEVWANMLWEGYVALLNDRGVANFADAQNSMMEYVIAGLKMTPYAPTYTEARDGILAAAYASDQANVGQNDFGLLAAAFAERGMGNGAMSPDRFDPYHDDVVQSTDQLGGAFAVTDLWLETETASVCDGDGILDSGETATLHVAVTNTGWEEITDATAQVTVTSGNGTVLGDGTINFGTLASPLEETDSGAAGRSGEGSVDVQLDAGLVMGETLTVEVVFSSATGTVTVPATESLSLPVHYDRKLTATGDDMGNPTFSGLDWSATVDDGGEDLAANWSLAPHTDTFPIEADAYGAGNVWYVPDNPLQSEAALVTPAFEIGNDPFSFTFSHRAVFEQSGSGDAVSYWDGGVLEIRIGDGPWEDATLYGEFDQGYNGQLVDSNPYLPGQAAFVGLVEADETIEFGTRLRGKTVQLRFRAVSDQAIGDIGWVIDQVNATGAVVPAFSAMIAENGVCGNDLPKAIAGDDQSVGHAASVTLDGSASADPDGGALGYLWEQLDGSSVTLSGTAAANASFTAPGSNDVLVFRLTVTDDEGEAVSDLVTVAVNGGEPVADAGADIEAQPGETVNLDGSGSSDPDGDTLYYRWEQIAGSTVVLNGFDTASPNFDAQVEGDYRFRLTVEDEYGGKSTDSVTVSVKAESSTSGGGNTGGGGGGGSVGLPLILGLGLLLALVTRMRIGERN